MRHRPSAPPAHPSSVLAPERELAGVHVLAAFCPSASHTVVVDHFVVSQTGMAERGYIHGPRLAVGSSRGATSARKQRGRKQKAPRSTATTHAT
mmetsp:Transcript_29453/g.90291  ORF Transcript_29453/g.90291 Transcript_29453/m.90291 type:complete len:94 (+) Transcript_29453:862-1143(+)|eukprot:scaffold57770_cov28-Tisochrysis_lutea.AAC.3